MFTSKTYFILCWIIGVIDAQALPKSCNGKNFLCTDQTHFQICIDIGSGLTITGDNVVQQCPPQSFCDPKKSLECEGTRPTTKGFIEISTVPRVKITTTTAKPVVPNTCPGGGTFGDPSNCHIYYKCIGSIKFQYFCPFNTVFDSVTKTCSTNKDSCGTLIKDFQCILNGKFPDPKSCYSFFTCLRSGTKFTITRTNCNSMSSFHSLLGSCKASTGGCIGKI